MTPRRWIFSLLALAAIVSGVSFYLTRPDPMLAVVYLTDGQGHGTGFAIDEHTVVTNAHVVKGRKMMGMTLLGGMVEVRDIWIAGDADLAVLTVEPALPHTLSVACEWPDAGAAIQALGHPLGALWAAHTGRVASALPWQSDDLFVVLDVPVVEGMSGGPVVDWRGRVVAVNVAYSAIGAASVSLGIPGDQVCAAIEEARHARM